MLVLSSWLHQMRILMSSQRANAILTTYTPHLRASQHQVRLTTAVKNKHSDGEQPSTSTNTKEVNTHNLYAFMRAIHFNCILTQLLTPP